MGRSSSKDSPQGLKGKRKMAFVVERDEQGLKPDAYFAAFAARVNSCPDTNHLTDGVFPQPVKPGVHFWAFAARLNSCPDKETDMQVRQNRGAEKRPGPEQAAEIGAFGRAESAGAKARR